MCLAKAYIGKDNEVMMEEIASLKVEGGKILLATLFGEQKEIEAGIEEIDFMSGRVTLKEN